MQVSVRILADGKIEIKSDDYPVQYVEPGAERFGVSYDEYRAHGDGPMEIGPIVDVTELYEGQAFTIIGGPPLSNVRKPQ